MQVTESAVVAVVAAAVVLAAMWAERNRKKQLKQWQDQRVKIENDRQEAQRRAEQYANSPEGKAERLRQTMTAAAPAISAPAMSGPIAYVETREPRRGWGKFWVLLLVLWTLMAAYDVFHFSSVATEVSKGSNGFATLAVSNMATNKIIETLVVWFFGALVLGLFIYLTRGAKVMQAIPVRSIERRR